MESQTPQTHLDLKTRLLQLLQTGVRGAVLASLTLVPTGNVEAAPSTEKPRATLEERLQTLRDQKEATTEAKEGADSQSELLAWGNWHNWHNWRNGWNNGWNNWHNWHNW